MSEGVQDVTDQQAAAPAGITAGAMLQQARLASGMHIATLASALKIPVYKLEALEGDRFDVFPDVIFVRALASSICRTLKVDAAPVLALLPHGASPRLPADRGINTAFKDSSTKKSKGLAMAGASSGARWVPLVVVVLLLAAVALVFVPGSIGNWSLSGGQQDEPRSSAAGAGTPAGVVQEPPVAVDVPAPSAAEPASRVGPSPSAAAGVTEPLTLPMQPQAAASFASPDAAAVVVKARGETWVQIRSISGGHSAQRVLQAGQSLSGPGPAPWAVVIGKAAVAEVLVRGEPLELSTIARENVARFEVK